MIETLQFKNFKSWQDTGEMRFGRITGLFGSNSSGKSSILQFLLMLKETVESQDRLQPLDFGGEEDRHYVNLGSFNNIIYKGDSSQSHELSWNLSWSVAKSLQILDPTSPNDTLFDIKRLSHQAQLAMKKGGLAVSLSEYSFFQNNMEYHFGMRSSPRDSKEYDLISEGYEIRRIVGRAWPLPSPIKCYAFPDQVNSYYQNGGFLNQFSEAFQDLLNGIYYLGPLRDYPQPEYKWAGSKPFDVGRRGENAIAALLASQGTRKISRGKGHASFTLEQYVSYWLKELGLVHDFRVEEISPGSNLYRAFLRQYHNGPEVLINEVGFGISQILPVLTICYSVPENSTVILEQPEIHLHPYVQTLLADVFIDAIKVRKIQLIIESHSEHLLLRLQRRIAEEQLRSEDISLYFCERSDNRSVNKPLELDEYGNIINWPENFFGDEFHERTEMMRSIARRKKAA